MLLGEAVHDEEFIERVFEWRGTLAFEAWRVQKKSGATEFMVDQKAFVRSIADRGADEIELKSIFRFVESPDGSGIEKLMALSGRKRGKAFHANVNVGIAPRQAEGFESGIEGYVGAKSALNCYRESANAKAAMMNFGGWVDGVKRHDDSVRYRLAVMVGSHRHG